MFRDKGYPRFTETEPQCADTWRRKEFAGSSPVAMAFSQLPVLRRESSCFRSGIRGNDDSSVYAPSISKPLPRDAPDWHRHDKKF